MFEILGYMAAFFMGITLGVIGGGGSILTVPILVYLMGIDPTTSTGYSLLLVGATAAFGAYRYYKTGGLNIKQALTFAIPSVISVYVTRAFIMPAIPDILWETPYLITRDKGILILFAALMIVSAVMMLRKRAVPPRPSTEENTHHNHPALLIILEGSLVGLATGLLGAGGGFLIIPALVLLMGMPMKEAVGTSLFIISLKSLIGFMGDIQTGVTLQFPMLFFFFIATVSGMFSATYIAAKIDGKKLQKLFAYFTLIIAVGIFVKELF